MDWIQIIKENIPNIGVFLLCFGFLYREMRRIENRLEESIKKQAARSDQLSARSDQLSARSDKLYEMFQEGLKSQAERSDRLYDMFIDLLKEKKA